MCSFIILLLLLCKNNGSCGCNCNAGEYTRSREYNRRNHHDHDHYRSRNDDYRKKDDRDCGCSACEDVTQADESPIVEREDIWTSYKNTCAGKQSK